jgi:hypothetical protein
LFFREERFIPEYRMKFSDYIIENEGVVICEPCLTISLFSNLDLATAPSSSVLAPYDAFLRSFGKQFTYCRLSGDQMHFRRVTAACLETLPQQMADSKRRKKGGVVAEFRSGRSRDECRTPAIEFEYSRVESPHTAMRLYLPLKWFDESGLPGVLDILASALTDFPLQSGYVGYTFLWDSNLESIVEPYFFHWLQRHPGLMEPRFSHASVAHHGLTDIGWMTLLGQAFVEKTGGLDALKHDTSGIAGIQFDEFPFGSIGVRLGDMPRLGDLAQGDTMDDYRALGRILARLRNKSALHDGMTVAGFRDRDNPGMRVKWIDRFFPE